MIASILAAAAIPAQPARYSDPPEIHAIYFDGGNTDGVDFNPDMGPARGAKHDCTVELYAPTVDAGAAALSRLIAQLDSRSIRYTTQGWYWLNTIQRYQEVIEFSYIEKY